MSAYYYNSDGLSSTITSLHSKLDEYSNILEKISTLKDSIANSNEWVQSSVKPEFIAKCEQYILVYGVAIAKLEAYVNYIEAKNIEMENLESSYS